MRKDNLTRLARFKLNEKRRQVEQLELMMAEFDRMCADLEAQVISEEKKSGITDQTHFAYPMFAKAARQRRENLGNSVNDLRVQINAAKIALEEAEAEFEHAEKLQQRETMREEAEIPKQAAS
ncbi:flagellar export protein FliJ [Fulvimarina sp. 2208YS6-2-32]